MSKSPDSSPSCFSAEAVASEEEVSEGKLVVNEDWDRWMPDPLEALHHTGPPWKRRIDLLSLLVGIYGSKKSFLVEYRNLLGQRLLRQLNFDTAAQMRHLELLKLRFGEADLQECEVDGLFTSYFWTFQCELDRSLHTILSILNVIYCFGVELFTWREVIIALTV
ncbi:unnamed protein product [Hydatigera taeniaeformis]|uniref:CULLIN_2 domain-containing protein n=1 Tax=Hydatigena taeniaeformis TaxID=6205 RepID=A0A0R3WVS2_HYDTA|nr:unnamed protein product [Hydatigera taeniaeformis]